MAIGSRLLCVQVRLVSLSLELPVRATLMLLPLALARSPLCALVGVSARGGHVRLLALCVGARRDTSACEFGRRPQSTTHSSPSEKTSPAWRMRKAMRFLDFSLASSSSVGVSRSGAGRMSVGPKTMDRFVTSMRFTLDSSAVSPRKRMRRSRARRCSSGRPKTKARTSGTLSAQVSTRTGKEGRTDLAVRGLHQTAQTG